jgi:hypothetical protein
MLTGWPHPRFQEGICAGAPCVYRGPCWSCCRPLLRRGRRWASGLQMLPNRRKTPEAISINEPAGALKEILNTLENGLISQVPGIPFAEGRDFGSLCRCPMLYNGQWMRSLPLCYASLREWRTQRPHSSDLQRAPFPTSIARTVRKRIHRSSQVDQFRMQ